MKMKIVQEIKEKMVKDSTVLYMYIAQGLLASVAQLDARPTGDQEVAGSTPAEVGNILSWRLIMKYFLCHSLPSADSRRAVVSFWQKNVHNTG